MNDTIAVTLHLPGLKKTVQYSYDRRVSNDKLTEKIATEFGQEPRRSNVYLIGEGIFGSIRALELWVSSTRPVKNGDVLVLCVRETTVPGQNDYYNTQQDALFHNKYLNPPIALNIASDLLIQIKVNFALLGHRHFLPDTPLANYSKYLGEELSKYYELY